MCIQICLIVHEWLHRTDPYYDPREDDPNYTTKDAKPNAVDGLVIWHSLNKMLEGGQGADELVNGAPRYIYYYSVGNQGMEGDAVYHYADETTLSKTYRSNQIGDDKYDLRFMTHTPGSCNENMANYNILDPSQTPTDHGCTNTHVEARRYPCGLSLCDGGSVCTRDDPCSFNLISDPYETSTGRGFDISDTFMGMSSYESHLPGAKGAAQDQVDFPYESYQPFNLVDEWCVPRLQYSSYFDDGSTPDVLANPGRTLADTETGSDFKTLHGVFMEGELLSKSINQDAGTCGSTCMDDDHCAGFTRVTPTTGSICFFWRVQPGQQEQSMHAYYGSAFGSYYASPESYEKLKRFPMPPPSPSPPPPSPSPQPAPPPPPSPPPPSPSPPRPSPPPPSPSP